MPKLIDADALISSVLKKAIDDAFLNGNTDMHRLLIQVIAHQPTIGAEPVRHGRWKNDCMGVLRCSECNAQAPWRFVGRGYNEVDYRWKSDYCPNCGARMNEE